PHDRVANLFNGGGLWAAFLAIGAGIDELGAVHLPIGGNLAPAETLRVLRDLGCTVLVGLPSTLLRLAHAAEAESGLAPALRTGDHGREILEPCRCGASAFTFDLLGRSDDMVRIGGANVHVSDVERLCAGFPADLSHFFQLHIRKEGVDDALDVVIETRAPL